MPTLQRELGRFKLPQQELAFSVHHLSLDDDAALSMAFYSALRTSTIPSLRRDGRFVALKRRWLSSECQRDVARG